jgi:uncharacterized protein
VTGPGCARGRRAAATLGGLAALLTALTGLAEARTPLPQRDLDHSVYDPAGVIRIEHEARMEAMHAALYRGTGVAIVAIAVPALEDETIEELAVRVGTEWGVGKKGEDRGIVVALARDDRRIFIATGYGVEGYLPDGKVGAILDEQVRPYVRQGDFSTALYQASVALVTASAEEYGVRISGSEPPPPPQAQPGGQWQSWVGGVIVGIIFLYLLIRHPRVLLMLLWSGMGRRGGSGGGGFGGGRGFGGFGGGGFGGGGAGRRF